MDTYRYHGHSMSDPGSTYRTRDEVSGVRQVKFIAPLQNYVLFNLSVIIKDQVSLTQERDPIERIRKLILTHDLATTAELKVFHKTCSIIFLKIMLFSRNKFNLQTNTTRSYNCRKLRKESGRR